MVNVETLIGFFVIGTIWGASDAFMEVGTKKPDSNDAKDTQKQQDQENQQNKLDRQKEKDRQRKTDKINKKISKKQKKLKKQQKEEQKKEQQEQNDSQCCQYCLNEDEQDSDQCSTLSNMSVEQMIIEVEQKECSPISKIEELSDNTDVANDEKSILTEKKNETEPNALEEVLGYFTNIRFVLPYIVNQLASLGNNFLIATTELQIAIPVVNCVTFISAFITQKLLLKESLIDYQFFLGVTLIIGGIVVSLESSGNNPTF